MEVSTNMPNFDTGHYFLTILSPIKEGSMVNEKGESISFDQNLQDILRILPRALQSPTTEQIGINSPFSQEKSTHFCRFAIIDDIIFHGKERSNVVIRSLLKINPLDNDHIDKLNSKYLLFTSDFDAVMNIGDSLPEKLSKKEQNDIRDAYARRLWDKLKEELQNVYSNCIGFEAVKNADDFAKYIEKCQIETSMPFNDYWITPPKLPKKNLFSIISPAVVTFIGSIVSLLFYLSGKPYLPFLNIPSGSTFVYGIIIFIIIVYLIYRYILWSGEKPMPPGKFADLPSILKSIYIQQNFKEFAISAQLMNDAELYSNFEKFLQQNKLYDLTSKTQASGVIYSNNDINNKGDV